MRDECERLDDSNNNDLPKVSTRIFGLNANGPNHLSELISAIYDAIEKYFLSVVMKSHLLVLVSVKSRNFLGRPNSGYKSI